VNRSVQWNEASSADLAVPNLAMLPPRVQRIKLGNKLK
jgi:hypothetical protein